MSPYDEIVRRFLPGVEYHQNRYARELGAAVFLGCRWLDLGAGARVHGGWLRPSQQELARRARVLCGCDLVAEHLAGNPHLSTRVVAQGRHLPFCDNSFDLVTANMVFEHLDEPAHVLAEAARVLKPRGRLVFVTPNRKHPVVWLLSVLAPSGWRRWLALRIEGRPPERVFPTRYLANTRRRIEVLAEAAGLRVERLTVFPSYPMFRRLWLFTLIETAWIRAQRWPPLRDLGSNLVGTLTKPASQSRRGSASASATVGLGPAAGE